MDLFVATNEVGSWSSEEIPGEDHLWMRVHRVDMENGEILPRGFKNRPTTKDGMSTDWDKYATAQDTRNRGRVPLDNAVIRLNVGTVREIPDQTVVHTPDLIKPNRAHTDVFGKKHPEARVLLIRAATIVIPL
jgi:hypothetical protein